MKKNIWWKIPVVLIALIIGITIFCLTPQAIETMTPYQLIAYERAITPKIEAFDNYGNHLWWASGVWLDEHHVLTAAHVVQPNREVGDVPTCWLISNKYSATKVQVDVNHDVALLTVDETRRGPIAKIDLSPLKTGDEVVVCGWMVGVGLETTWGRVANPAGQGEAAGDIVCAIVCTHGASGGPVLHNGKLVGIVSRGRDGLLIIEPICMGVK